jgi:hypothetical protein
MRLNNFVAVLACLAAGAGTAAAQLKWRSVAGTHELTENGKPVLVYRSEAKAPEGVPADRSRCCYVHPLYAPNGAVVTDDYPKDHYHHRGMGWMWPIVEVDGKRQDTWALKGDVVDRQDRISTKGGKEATVKAEDGWYLGAARILREGVEMVIHPLSSGNQRDIDVTLTFAALRPGIRLSGSPDNKGYGGFCIRFAPRTETVVNSENLSPSPSSDMKPNMWAEIKANYGGKRATTRITINPSNPGAPNGWCLRPYGFLGVNFPGLDYYTLDPAKPLVMKYRVTLTSD